MFIYSSLYLCKLLSPRSHLSSKLNGVEVSFESNEINTKFRRFLSFSLGGRFSHPVLLEAWLRHNAMEVKPSLFFLLFFFFFYISQEKKTFTDVDNSMFIFLSFRTNLMNLNVHSYYYGWYRQERSLLLGELRMLISIYWIHGVSASITKSGKLQFILAICNCICLFS